MGIMGREFGMNGLKLTALKEDGKRTYFTVGDVCVGRDFLLIAGPCSVESEAQIMEAAKWVKASGANVLRGGTFKPRMSPYSFQGLGREGILLLKQAGKEFNLPVVTEVTDTRDVEFVAKYADILQIGARNMQNFSLLEEVGKTNRPVLLKRGMTATLEEFLNSAEYILSAGNPHVILCERGIRTFEPYTRNTLDLSAVPALKTLTHLPIIVDPSHATGRRELVVPMSLSAVAAGCDGLEIEMHPTPETALSDAEQQLTEEELLNLVKKVKKSVEFHKTL